MSKTNSRKIDEIAQSTLSKFEELKNRLREMRKVLVAFSGGVDSSFLLKVAADVLEENVLAVIASSETYPSKEREEAIKLARKKSAMPFSTKISSQTGEVDEWAVKFEKAGAPCLTLSHRISFIQ